MKTSARLRRRYFIATLAALMIMLLAVIWVKQTLVPEIRADQLANETAQIESLFRTIAYSELLPTEQAKRTLLTRKIRAVEAVAAYQVELNNQTTAFNQELIEAMKQQDSATSSGYLMRHFSVDDKGFVFGNVVFVIEKDKLAAEHVSWQVIDRVLLVIVVGLLAILGFMLWLYGQRKQQMLLTTSFLTSNKADSLFAQLPHPAVILDQQGNIKAHNQQFQNQCPLSSFNHLAELMEPGQVDVFLSYLNKRCYQQQESASFNKQVQLLSEDEQYASFDVTISSIAVNDERLVLLQFEREDALSLMQQELQRAVKLKSAISDASLDALITIDMQGNVIEYNRAAERTLGWSRGKMLGEKMEDFIIPEAVRHMHAKGFAHFVETGEGPLIGNRVETEAQHENGCLIPVELALVPSEIDGQRYCTAFIRDISERKQAEQQIRQEKEIAEQASQAKSRFLSYMSHEIRSPLNAVLNSINLVASKVSRPDLTQLLKISQASGQALLGVINEILDFSKIEAGHIEIHESEVNIVDLVRETLYAIQAKHADKGFELVADIDSNVSEYVRSDEGKLRQIMTILLDNAGKYTELGTVELKLQLSQEQQLIITVADTGAGITNEQKTTIFQEFEQADATRDERFGGTGLGLTIATRLIQCLQGSIQVYDNIPAGSCFEVTIPVTISSDVSLTGIEMQGTAVVISPNAAFSFALKNQLTRAGLEVHSALTVAEGVQFMQDTSVEQSINYLLLDDSALADKQSHEQISWPESCQCYRLANYSEAVKVPLRLGEKQILKPILNIDLLEHMQGKLMAEVVEQKQPLMFEGHLLLVDDVESNLVVAGELLRGRGFTVDCANSGKQAIAMCAESAYDVILMDLRMPELNGFDALNAIREHSNPNQKTPCIALTANAEKGEIERCEQAGFNGFVSKPFDATKLLMTIKHWVEYEGDEFSDTSAKQYEQVETATEAAELLSEQVLQQLEMDTSAAAVPRMLEMFQKELAVREQNMQQAYADKNIEQIREEAHALKSCSGTFGATALHELCKLAENLASSGNTEPLFPLLEQLLSVLVETKTAYERFMVEKTSNVTVKDKL